MLSLYHNLKAMYMESRIKELLKEKGITISDLADKIGTAQTSLSRALGENGNPTYETLNKISKALGVDMSELFKNSDTNTITCPKCRTKFKMLEE